MRVLIFLVSSIFFQQANAQIIPPERAGNWSLAGSRSFDYSSFQVINVEDFGLTGDSSQIISEELNDLIEDTEEQSVLFYFPEGIYVFDKQIRLSSNKILKGDSVGTAEFRFLDLGRENRIQISGTVLRDSFSIENAPQKDSFKITIEQDHDFEPGDFVYIFQDDADKVFSSWALNSTGHLATVGSVNGNSIFIVEPMNQHFDDDRNPTLIEILPIENVGVECLKIVPLFAAPNQASNIFIKYARNCLVSGIESINADFSHVRVNLGANISIFGSYFQDAFFYGNGGQGYGVTLGFGSTRCLIENNIFNHLRHSILMQAGANNNVGAYNYSKNPHWRGVSLPFGAAGELVLHGNYTFANLFEGNIVQNIAADDSHSNNGPFNTFFRNRTDGYGITNGLAPPSDSQNLVANLVIPNPDPFVIPFFFIPGEGHLLLGNFVNGAIRPVGSESISDTSLYLTQIPPFLTDYSEWELIGAPDGLNIANNPAKLRSEVYDVKTYCKWEGFPPDTTSTEVINISNTGMQIFPNPSHSGFLHFRNFDENSIQNLSVFNTIGQRVFEENDLKKGASVDLTFLPKGIYFLQFWENEVLKKSFKWVRN